MPRWLKVLTHTGAQYKVIDLTTPGYRRRQMLLWPPILGRSVPNSVSVFVTLDERYSKWEQKSRGRSRSHYTLIQLRFPSARLEPRALICKGFLATRYALCQQRYKMVHLYAQKHGNIALHFVIEL